MAEGLTLDVAFLFPKITTCRLYGWSKYVTLNLEENRHGLDAEQPPLLASGA
jgi:hypothetical protein